MKSSTIYTDKPLYNGDAATNKILDSYMKDIRGLKLLGLKMEGELAKRIREGDNTAIDELVSANLLFVVNVANKYSNQGIPVVDLINIGNMGLIKAAKKFDERKNFKFISYAVWWIRQAILDALAKQSRVVKIPYSKATQIFNIRKTKEKIEREEHREASSEELQTVLKLKNSETLDRIMSIDISRISLDSPVNEGVALVDCLQDENDTPEEEAIIASEREYLIKNLNTLSKLEKKIICDLFGIDKIEPKSLAELGRKYKCSRERVRQIKNRALKKLKRKYAQKEV
jgi:RNA polymerase primary sigma factor